MKQNSVSNSPYGHTYYHRVWGRSEESKLEDRRNDEIADNLTLANKKDIGSINRIQSLITQLNDVSVGAKAPIAVQRPVESSPTRIAPRSSGRGLLPPQSPDKAGKKTLVLDLDETLVHSAFQSLGNEDMVLPLHVDGKVFYVYVLKRPGVDEFLKQVAQLFEVVIFTASMPGYANPLIDKLDPQRRISHRLFREHCSVVNGNYVKDLSSIGRSLSSSLIIDNCPTSYSLQRTNALPILTWLDNRKDRQLLDMLPFLELLASLPGDVRQHIQKVIHGESVNYSDAYRQLQTLEKKVNPIVNNWIEEKEAHQPYEASPILQKNSKESSLAPGYSQLAQSYSQKERFFRTDPKREVPARVQEKPSSYSRYARASLEPQSADRSHTSWVDRNENTPPIRDPGFAGHTYSGGSKWVTDTPSETRTSHAEMIRANSKKSYSSDLDAFEASTPIKTSYEKRYGQISEDKTDNPDYSKRSYTYSNLSKLNYNYDRAGRAAPEINSEKSKPVSSLDSYVPAKSNYKEAEPLHGNIGRPATDDFQSRLSAARKTLDSLAGNKLEEDFSNKSVLKNYGGPLRGSYEAPLRDPFAIASGRLSYNERPYVPSSYSRSSLYRAYK